MRKSKQEIRDEAALRISLAMKRLVSTGRLLLEAELEPDGITLAQLRMLKTLQETSELSSAELARACFVTPQSMQTLVARAEREGWIKRSPAPQNRRILTATLTTTGRGVLERGMGLWTSISREMWGGIQLSEMEELHRILNLAVEHLQPRLNGLHDRPEKTHPLC